MAADKTKMKAELDVDPFEEADKKVKDWAKTIPLFVKKLKNVTYSDTLELDPRKWNEKKLTKALEELVRYELKIFAVRAAEYHKTALKEGPRGQLAAEKGLPKDYLELEKDVTDKCSTALEELAADKGDNKKALRDGKAAVKELAKQDLKKIFSTARTEIAAAFTALSSDLKKAMDQEKAKDAAALKARNVMDKARAAYDKDFEDSLSVLSDMLQTAGQTLKNAEANAALKTYSKLVLDYEDTFGNYAGAGREFETDMDEAANDVSARKLDSEDAKKKAAAFLKLNKPDSAAAAVETAAGKLAKAFADTEKELK